LATHFTLKMGSLLYTGVSWTFITVVYCGALFLPKNWRGLLYTSVSCTWGKYGTCKDVL